MSKVMRIGLVAEGVTDYLVLQAAISGILNEQPFILTLFQPEQSVAFSGRGNAGQFGGGWRGVWQWCQQAAARAGGRLRDDPVFLGYDMLILHLDVDVAHESTAHDVPGLPCSRPCPPAHASVDALRLVLLGWAGEVQTPPQTVLCTPAQSTEAWVVAACFPGDGAVLKGNWECHGKPERRLGQQPKLARFGKNQADYLARQVQIQNQWPCLVATLGEAKRFQAEFLAAL